MSFATFLGLAMIRVVRGTLVTFGILFLFDRLLSVA